MKKNNRTKTVSVPFFKCYARKVSSLALFSVALSVFHVSQIHAQTLIGWDIPVSGATSATIQGTPVSGISGTTIALGSGLSISTSSTAWRVTSLNNTSGFSTATTGANATSDYFQWSLTTSARTTAQITGSTGFLWTASGTGPSTSAELWVSTNGGSSFTQLGSAATLGASEVNVGNSWFNSPFNIAAGTTVVFRAAPLGATGGASSPKIAWNAGASPYTGAQDVTLTGTTGGGAWNLSWNGGATGAWNYSNSAWLKDGTGSGVSFVAGDNAAISSASAIAVDAGGITAGAVTVSNGSGTVALTGGALAAGSLTKSGAGNLTLANSGAYSGGVTASAGSITLDNSAALGSATLTLNGGTMAVTNAGVTLVANAIAVGASGGTVFNSVATTLGGAVTGTGILTKVGSEKLTLTNTVGASGVGNSVQLSVNEGSLVLANAAKYLTNASIASGAQLVLDGVTLNTRGGTTSSGAGTIVVTNNSTVVNSTANNTIANVISISAGSTLNMNNSSTFRNTLSGGINGSGNLSILTGETRISGTSANNGTAAIAAGATMKLLDASAADLKFANNGVLQFSNSSSQTYNGNITGTGATTISGAGSTTLVGNVAGGLLTIDATGSANSVVLGGNNTFTGLTITGSVGLVSGKQVTSFGSGTLASTVTTAKIGIDSSMGTGNNWTLANAVNTGVVSTDTMAFAPGTGNSINLNGVVSGAGLLKVSSGGDLYVNNTGNTYSGGTEIGTGRIIITNSAAIGGGAINFGTASGSVLQAADSMTLANATTISGVSGTSSSTTAYTANIEVANGKTLNLSGGLNNKLAVGTTSAEQRTGGLLNKLGDGVLVLSGANNNYSGATTVSAGTLMVNGTSTASAITVNSGASLGGSGSVGGVTLSAGSLLKPGNSPGNLTASSSVWNSGATYEWQISSLTGTAGTNWDLFTVSGALDLTNLSSSAKFNLTLDSGGVLAGFSDTADYSWTFAKAASITGITTDVGTDITSLFNIASGNFNGGVAPTNGFKVLVGETTGGYTSLNIVPEPSTPALMGLGMVALLAVRSMRRRLS